MKNENTIRDAIDESLGGIRFNAQDMRSVLRAARDPETREPERQPRRRLDFAFAMVMALIVIAPLSVLALKAGNTHTATITAAPQSDVRLSAAPGSDVLLPPSPSVSAVNGISEGEAIRIARECFNTMCDTTVFTFEEYSVSIRLYTRDTDESHAYLVDLVSIYDNGCSFTVTIDERSGSILSTSTPRLATVPTHLNSDSPEVQTWYEKNGPYLFTWSAADQAEFSRRYEGCTLRLPREDELSAQDAALAALSAVSDQFSERSSGSISAYPMLYAERAFSDGMARYQVYCFDSPIEEASSCLLVTLRAMDGIVESVQSLSASDWLY